MKRRSVRTAEAGVGMIEVLVALLVLSIGAVGFAALQVRAMQSTSGSYFRSQAMEIAQNLAERYRLNRGQSTVYMTASNWVDPATVTSAPTGCISTTCTAAQLAAFDVTDTLYTVNSLLPQGRIRMEACQNTVTSVNCIYVGWNGNTATAGGTGATCVASTGLYVAGTPDCIMLETR